LTYWLLAPAKLRQSPNLQLAPDCHVGELYSVPVFPLPLRSSAEVPDPSSIGQYPTSPVVSVLIAEPVAVFVTTRPYGPSEENPMLVIVNDVKGMVPVFEITIFSSATPDPCLIDTSESVMEDEFWTGAENLVVVAYTRADPPMTTPIRMNVSR
jgi:hypothetical protein